jgi:formate hydrogenlyase transcriptional activator
VSAALDETSPAGAAVIARKPLLIRRAEAERYSSPVFRRLLGAGLQSFVCIPLVTRAGVLGTLNVASVRDDAFTPEDVDLLAQIGNEAAIALENALAYRQIAVLKDKLAEEKLYLEDEIRTAYDFEEIVGESPVWKRVLAEVETVAPTDSTVLIGGESGTGKELIARAIHHLSHRRDRTFVKVNCAAIPTGLLESELFGHEKGAFTGAIAQKIGRFELAHHGTLFLDEIGDIPLELQPKLLRVLQEREFERLGGTRTIHVDVRLVTATNRDLHAMVTEREFRQDLFYRVNVFPIVLPPLRERKEDIPLLVRYFAQKYARRMDKRIETIPGEAMEALVRWPWPGNVRELENLMERAVILTRGQVLQVPLGELRQAGEIAGASSTLAAAERDHILRVLRDTDWVIGGPQGAAQRLGMKRTTLQSKMRKLGIVRT